MVTDNTEQKKRCAYCGEVRPLDEMAQGTISFRDRKPYPGAKAFVNHATNWYCKDKPCHAHDQMGHEG